MAHVPYSKVLKGCCACARAYGSGPERCFVALGLVPDGAHSVLKGTQRNQGTQGFLHEEETPFFTCHELTRFWLYKAKAADNSASTTSYHERIPFPPFRQLKASATSPRVSSIGEVNPLPSHPILITNAFRSPRLNPRVEAPG